MKYIKIRVIKDTFIGKVKRKLIKQNPREQQKIKNKQLGFTTA